MDVEYRIKRYTATQPQAVTQSGGGETQTQRIQKEGRPLENSIFIFTKQ